MWVSWEARFLFLSKFWSFFFNLSKRYNKLTKDKKLNWHTFPWQDLYWSKTEKSVCKSTVSWHDSCCYWLNMENTGDIVENQPTRNFFKKRRRKKKSLNINLYNFIVTSGNFNIHSQRGFFISLNWHWFICLGFFLFCLHSLFNMMSSSYQKQQKQCTFIFTDHSRVDW